MMTTAAADRIVRERGHRYAIFGTVRRGESQAQYADTAERAEVIYEQFADLGYRNVKVHSPQLDGLDLEALGRDRAKAKAAYDEATAALRAGVLRALEAGRHEAEVARTAGLNRMTVRTWAGKQ
jgi:hypothetical protein